MKSTLTLLLSLSASAFAEWFPTIEEAEKAARDGFEFP